LTEIITAQLVHLETAVFSESAQNTEASPPDTPEAAQQI